GSLGHGQGSNIGMAMRSRESAWGVLALATMTLAAPSTSHGDDTWDSVGRVVAVGDVHGDYDQLVTVLRDTGLVDDKTRWVGGKAWLVQTGDRVDRGPDSRKVMDLLQRLEEAAKEGG